jgi:hypothetical protein
LATIFKEKVFKHFFQFLKLFSSGFLGIVSVGRIRTLGPLLPTTGRGRSTSVSGFGRFRFALARASLPTRRRLHDEDVRGWRFDDINARNFAKPAQSY